MQSDYGSFYRRISAGIRDKKAHSVLIYFNMYFTYFMYMLYPLILIYDAFKRNGFFLKTLLIPMTGFFLLTMIRSRINRPRPYEKWDIEPLLDKSTRGNSMPSRHVFSAVVISCALMLIAPHFGRVLLLLCILYSAERVLIGVHYPSDVAVGYAAGLFCGWLLTVL